VLNHVRRYAQRSKGLNVFGDGQVLKTMFLPRAADNSAAI
jgi:hypothetical protein